MNILRKLICATAILAGFTARAATVGIIKADPKASSSVAIFVDKGSFEACRAEILAYRQTLQAEGLGAHILYAEWQTPEDLKKEIIKLSNSKPALEGLVLIGDIPVVRVRRGQFLTTAFKMNETTYPRIESSVTSDRFYDDLSLKFDFIGRDSSFHRLFYYNLSEEGAVSLHPTLYSGRIAVPNDFPGNRNEHLKTYLRKAVAAHQEENPLDNFIYFAGYAYNSDCMTVWLQQAQAFREYFPEAFAKSSGHKFLNYRQDPNMKRHLFNELQRKDVDLFFFSEHGTPDKQLINGEFPASTAKESIEELKRAVRDIYVRRYKGTAQADEYKKEIVAKYHLNPSVLCDEELEKHKAADSAASVAGDISLADIRNIKSNPKMIVLNSCYNGSFHKDAYVAACHLFNGGNTIVAQGNTVNVLQDKWADQLAGHLSLGLRVGQWQKEVITLETHLLGDPTFRFAAPKNDTKGQELSRRLLAGNKDTAYWNSLLKEKDPRLRAAAVKQLSLYYQEQGGKALAAFSNRLLTLFTADAGWTVRMQLLEQLSKLRDENFSKAVGLSLSDPYELIRRRGAAWAGKIGDPALIPPLISTLLFHPEAQRLQYTVQTALAIFEPAAVLDEYRKQSKNHPYPLLLDKQGNDLFISACNKTQGRLMNYAMSISSADAKPEVRESAIRYLRNNPLHHQLAAYLKLVSNEDESDEVRLLMAEALGWFEYSFRKDEIADVLAENIQTGKASVALKREMEKALKRL